MQKLKALHRKYLIFTISSVFLAGCGGGSNDGFAAAPATPPATVIATPPVIDTPPATTVDPLLIATSEGPVRGKASDGVSRFLGIPYAAPPEGPLRWKATAPAEKRNAEYDASYARSDCIQGSALNPKGKEDCLYLNIFRPDLGGAPVTKAPVLVWVHGGGYTSGSGIQYNVEPLAKTQGLVTVSINYRLGAFGFLAHPALSAEESPPRSGNYGIMDMQAALKWVKNNVQNFGGDPNNVTIFGESAGGNAMYVLLASPASAGLFNKVVPQSGAYYRNQPPLAAGESLGANLASTALGCPSIALEAGALPQLANCLRNISPSNVLEATSVNEPYVDGKILTETTASAFQAGRFNRVPVLAGSTRDEGTLFAASYLTQVTTTNYSSLADLGLPSEDVAAHYPLVNFTTPAQALARAMGDRFFYCGAMQDMDSISSFVPQSFVYQFDDPHPASPASFVQGYPTSFPGLDMLSAHAVDVTYWMGLILPSDATPARNELSRSMMSYLGNFAKTGTPTGDERTAWSSYDKATRKVMRLGYPLISDFDAYADHQCAFWYTAAPGEAGI